MVSGRHDTDEAGRVTWLRRPIGLIKNLLEGPLCIFNVEPAFRILPDVLFIVLEYKWHVMNVECVCRHICSKRRWLCEGKARVRRYALHMPLSVFVRDHKAGTRRSNVSVSLLSGVHVPPRMHAHVLQISTGEGCSFEIMRCCNRIRTSHKTRSLHLFWRKTFLKSLWGYPCVLSH